ncbi:hypothetical protein, partial [Longimicrobium sp.]|uniref:hypothetical protein n=1 Tax=Longimicrobium sp. TaxID=2029185 RepID=UPI002E3495B3
MSARALAVMVLSGDETLGRWLGERVDTATLARMEDVRAGALRALRTEVAPAVQQARRRCASRLVREAAR